jgi:hypothetical protein
MAAAWRNGNIESQAKMAINQSMAKYQWHGMVQRNKSCGENRRNEMAKKYENINIGKKANLKRKYR